MSLWYACSLLPRNSQLEIVTLEARGITLQKHPRYILQVLPQLSFHLMRIQAVNRTTKSFSCFSVWIRYLYRTFFLIWIVCGYHFSGLLLCTIFQHFRAFFFVLLLGAVYTVWEFSAIIMHKFMKIVFFLPMLKWSYYR